MQQTQLENQATIADGNWVAKVGVESFMKAHPEDRRTPRSERPLIVPVRHWARVFRVGQGEVDMFLEKERSTGPRDYGYVSIAQTRVLVSDDPFVAVHFRDHDELSGDRAKLRRGLTTARQVHKGELSRKPELPWKPPAFESLIPDPDNGYLASRRHDPEQYVRSNLRWVELSEFAKILGISAEDLIRGFAGFSPSTFYEPNVPLLRGMLRQEDIVRVYVGEVPKSFCGGERYWGGDNAVPLGSLRQVVERNNGRVWVPQAFAHTVIRLVQFGYQPSNEAPENSFRIEAPMPRAPEAKLPVLAAEELRELHELRQELPAELGLHQFTGAMAAFEPKKYGGDTLFFRPVPKLSDPLDGFAHYTNFRIVERHFRRVVLGICDWTRAGAEKGKNYWAGFLTVYRRHDPNWNDDPRRDRALLRIWFWPGECLRESPSGSKGGLCPDNIDPEIAVEVKNFLTRLGYTV